jgi:hypothetical protein
MKIKTISAFVLSASSAFALIGPGPLDTKTICLSAHEDKDGVVFAGSCDQARNNKTEKKDILANGCAEKQVAVTATKTRSAKEWSVKVYDCMPPHVVQL